MKKIKKAVRLYGHYVSISVRSAMQYKASFLLTAVGQFLVSFNVFLGILFMFKRFSAVEGFTYSQVLLCFSILLLEFSLAEMVARGFDMFPDMVRTGEFDRVLVRPQSEVLQVLGSEFELTRMGRMLQAVVMFVYGISAGDVSWDITKVLTIINMLVGGIVVFSAMFLIYAAFSFFSLEGLEFMNIFIDGAREYGKYPMGVYGKKILQITTFVIPYALVQYYPFLYLIGQETSRFFVFVPLLACWFMAPAWLLWRFGVRSYQSSGS